MFFRVAALTENDLERLQINDAGAQKTKAALSVRDYALVLKFPTLMRKSSREEFLRNIKVPARQRSNIRKRKNVSGKNILCIGSP